MRRGRTKLTNDLGKLLQLGSRLWGKKQIVESLKHSERRAISTGVDSPRIENESRGGVDELLVRAARLLFSHRGWTRRDGDVEY